MLKCGVQSSGVVESVVAGTNISVDNTDPANPVVNSPDLSGYVPYIGATASFVTGNYPIYGSLLSGGNLTLGSTSHGTKGKILFGNSAYDELNNRLIIGATTGYSTFDVNAGSGVYPNPCNLYGSGSGAVFGRIANTNTAGRTLFALSESAIDTSTPAYMQWYGSTHATSPSLFEIGTGGAHDFTISTNSTRRVTVKGSTGYFGVNITNPTSQFHVVANGQGINLQRETNGSDSWITFRDYVGGERGFFGYGSSGNNNFYISNGHSAAIMLYTAGAKQAELAADGKFGLGVTPSYKFETSGTATIADRTWAINGSIVMYLPNQTAGQYTGSLFISNGGRLATAGATGNTAVGIIAGTALTSGADNTFIGYGAGTGTTTGIRNVFIGSVSGVSNTTGGENLFMGYASGYSNTTGYGNTAIGGSALRYNQTGYGCTAIGFVALATGGVVANISNTVGIGQFAGYFTTGDSYCTYIGNYAGYANTTGQANTNIGQYSGYSNQTGSNNTYVGFQAGLGVAGNSQTSNSVVGRYALYAVTTGSYNSVLGVNAGFVLTTGQTNVFIGYNAGFTTTTGGQNILIGQVYTPTATTDYFMSLGNAIFATGISGTATTISPALVGILVNDPTAALDVAASTTTRASLRLRAGTRPTSPNAGDILFNGTVFEGYNGTAWVTLG